jgi:hypothetical protein
VAVKALGERHMNELVILQIKIMKEVGFTSEEIAAYFGIFDDLESFRSTLDMIEGV